MTCQQFQKLREVPKKYNLLKLIQEKSFEYGIIIKEIGTLAKIIPHICTHAHTVPGPEGFTGKNFQGTNDVKSIQVIPDHRKRESTSKALLQGPMLEENEQ